MRQRADPVRVERVDEPTPEPEAGEGHGANDGRQGLYLVLERHEVAVPPGTQGSLSIRVRNTGTLVERVTLGAPDLPSEWIRFEPAEVKLDVGAEAIVTMLIRPPRTSDAALG